MMQHDSSSATDLLADECCKWLVEMPPLYNELSDKPETVTLDSVIDQLGQKDIIVGGVPLQLCGSNMHMMFAYMHTPSTSRSIFGTRSTAAGDRLSTLSPYLFRVLLTAVEFKCTLREWYKLVHASVLNR